MGTLLDSTKQGLNFKKMLVLKFIFQISVLYCHEAPTLSLFTNDGVLCIK